VATLGESISFSHPSGAAEQQAIPTLAQGFYPGKVLSTLPGNNTCVVALDGLDLKLPCFWAGGFFGSLFGFKTSFVPPLKTRVLVYYSGASLSLVVAAYPDEFADPGQQRRSLTDPTGASDYAHSQVFASRNSTHNHAVVSHKPPIDLVEGEIQIDNLLGVGISLLRHLASLQAGDLAKVECHLLDDLVRIISENFTHHTAFGDYRVLNDGGKLQVIWHGTSHEHEAWGQLRAQDDKLRAQAGRPDQFDLSEIDGQSEEGRWRFSQYVGWLGDFVNLFVTDPVNAIGQLAESQVRSGKFRCHVNTDGALLVQSVSEIVLEKVVRIPVPIPLRREDDPQGNRTDDSVRSNDYLRTWKPTDAEHLFEMAFQLRQYARWFNNAYSLGRFRSQDRDYKVPTEAETPVPDVAGSAELEKQTLNQGRANCRLAYATIRIYRDGSVQWVDAYGNSMTSSAIGVQLASTTDLLLQAAGSVNIVAGRDINLLARKNVGITAATEKIRLRAQTGLYLLTLAGNTVLEAVSGFCVKLTGLFNVNNVLQVNRSEEGGLGRVHVNGNLTALRLAALITRPDHHGPGHLFIEAPAVSPVTDHFQHQSSYGNTPLYETISQQLLRVGDFTAEENWSWSGLQSATYGTPWPGAGAVQYQATVGASLNQASAQTQFSADAAPMPAAPAGMKAKS
jgi:hypothetical protein